ncbi:MAG TPA: NosD domain-containing protein [Candidatus Bathyarchaeia archaeon]|nr:NosD domain-containing protein [Candidatus Bathyarchaeia archaeon]
MKTKFRLYVILTVLLVGMFAATSKILLPQANATYVEGYIQQDTVWTLTDSPFIVINDVVVKSGYTLTIEPSVEVRFGGNFSLTVEGILNAIGTSEGMIKFVSNKDQPQLGDWGAIRFINQLQASTISYSVVKDATNGIVVENGNVQVRDCEIASNYQSGIYLTGNNIGTIEDNSIQLNRDGIILSGSTSGMTIRDNRISANIDNGIDFQNAEGTSISSVTIFNNTLSSNSRGINIFGSVSASVTRNSISFNDVGVYFENATSTVSPQFNDIYNNIYGVNVTASQPINMEYNYWGDSTGAYHASLNPYGKGNPVQSNGEDLDFIEFLSAPNGYINTQPTARLLTDKILVQPNQPVTFIGTNSSDDRRVDKYFFDFGDAQNTSWTTLSIFDHKYPSTGTYQANVKAMDDFGAISTNTAIVTITVSALTPLEVTVDLSHSQIVSEGQAAITARAMIGASPVSGVNIALMSILGGTITPQNGLTNSTGYFTASYQAPSVNEQTNVRLMARAYRTGNADGSSHKYLEVVPPLSVDLTVDLDLIKSEASINGTIHVTYNSEAVEGATVALASDRGGSFTPQSGSTDSEGWFKFGYKAPQTLTQQNVTLTATVTKIGYWAGSDQVKLSVSPRTLSVEVTANPTTVDSRDNASMTVHVASDGMPVANATVTVLSDVTGEFSSTTGLTDANGDFLTAFTTPETATLIDITISASATKSGYVDGQGQTSLAVNPSQEQGAGGLFGLSLTTLLLIIIPVIVVVIVVVLIKFKVIVFSRGEEPQ